MFAEAVPAENEEGKRMSRIHKRKFRGKLKYKYLAAFIGVSLFLALMLTFSY